MFGQLLILILGFALLIFGADYLVKGSSNIAKVLNVSEMVIGLTIVALGTSLPELLVSIVSATTGSTDIVMGNVIGSNICNLLLILGVVVVMKPIKLEKESIKKNFPLLIGITALILIMSLGMFFNTRLRITKADGFLLLIIAVIYFGIPILDFFKNGKNEKDKKVNDSEDSNSLIIKDLIFIVLGGFALKYGGDFAVNSSVKIANMLNISERVIGLTVVAIGTSLPELITSIVAIIKGNDEIAEGNIIGSCIINSCLILGTGAFIADIPLTASHIKDMALLLVSIVLIWLFALSNKENMLKREHGITLLIIYIIYSIKLFI